MSKPLLALCSVPKEAIKDGWAGRFAKIYLPFYGYWFASGARYVWPGSTIAQDGAPTISGHTMADTFQKDAVPSCLGH